MRNAKLSKIQSGISYRQRELQRVADILAGAAHQMRRRGATVRVLLITLGAVTASQASLGQMNSHFKEASGLVFLILGILITTLAGIEAAFKLETKGAELTLLAATCHSTVRHTDSVWQKQVGIEDDAEKQLIGAMQLLELQDEKLSEVQDRAANSGVNIALEVRKVYRSNLRQVASGDADDDDDDDDDDEKQEILLPRFAPGYAVDAEKLRW